MAHPRSASRGPGQEPRVGRTHFLSMGSLGSRPENREMKSRNSTVERQAKKISNDKENLTVSPKSATIKKKKNTVLADFESISSVMLSGDCLESFDHIYVFFFPLVTCAKHGD